jgi:hypothetical protein
MEVIWNPANFSLKMEDVAKLAYQAFLDSWTGDGYPAELDYETSERLSPRTPMQALEMIYGYLELRRPALLKGEFKVLAVERAFAVPLDPEDDTLFYVGRIDKVVERQSRILGVEHKTTTAYARQGKFRNAFTDSFSPNSQVDGYHYALHIMFPGRVGGIWIDAALVHKSEEGFKFIPIERQLSQIDSWLWEVQYWIAQIEMNERMLAEANPNARIMTAFPKNTNACWDFNTPCQFTDLCKSWPNPLKFDKAPGYGELKWDPLEHTGPIKELEDNA